MSAPAVRRRLWPGVDQLLLRSLIPLGVLVSLVAATGAGARPTQWVQAGIVVLAVVTTVRPDSGPATVALLGSAYVWTLAPETLSPLVLLGAAGMLLAHVAALLAAQAPALSDVDLAQVRLWAGRALLLWLGAVVVWGLDRAAVRAGRREVGVRRWADRAERGQRAHDLVAAGRPRSGPGGGPEGQYQPWPCLKDHAEHALP